MYAMKIIEYCEKMVKKTNGIFYPSYLILTVTYSITKLNFSEIE